METQLKSRWIKGFKGLYSVREDGAVRSHDRLTPHGKGEGSRFIKGRWLKTGKTGKGYPNLILRAEGKSHNKMIHRLVAEAFIPNPSCLPEVNHIDGDKNNNHVSNLEWCTGQYNIDHAWATGLYANVGIQQ